MSVREEILGCVGRVEAAAKSMECSLSMAYGPYREMVCEPQQLEDGRSALDLLPDDIQNLQAEVSRLASALADAKESKRSRLELHPADPGRLHGRVCALLCTLPPARILDTPRAPQDLPEVPEMVRERMAEVRATLRQEPQERDGAKHRQTKRRRRQGRPQSSDPKADQKVYDAWRTRGWRTFEELGSVLGMSHYDVRRAVDRHRKRQRPT